MKGLWSEKMSEKRYRIDYSDKIVDTETEQKYYFEDMEDWRKIVELLNEQDTDMKDLIRTKSEAEFRLSMELRKTDNLKKDLYEKNDKIKKLTIELADLKTQFCIP